MRRVFMAAVIMGLPFSMQAQLGGFINRAKDKVNQRINNKADQAVDKALDDMEGKKTTEEKPKAQSAPKQATQASKENDEAKEETGKATLTSYSKFDFIPGDKVLYAEDFMQDVIGEIPLTWNASGKGEVQTIEGKQGKWLRLFQGNTFLSGNTKSFGENFTIEFDMIYYFQPKKSGYVLPDVTFGIFSSGDKETTDNEFLHGQHQFNSVSVNLQSYGSGAATLSSTKKGLQSFHSDRVSLNGFDKNFNKVVHYAIQVQKTRFRMWVNDLKAFDIPRAVNLGDTLNQLFFKMEGSNYKDDEIGAFVNNIKVATGVPDSRHKLINEGKFSTTGILFDFQSAAIKKESYGVIKDIANVLKENPSVKIRIVGHTSNDGDAAANLELSKLRSAAVRTVLVTEYAIDGGNITTEGKGGTTPVADNKTNEGKAQNRRVEFIKI
jgi:OmpA-OmpF porin, OOP family